MRKKKPNNYNRPTNSFGYKIAFENFHYCKESGDIFWKKSPSKRLKAGAVAGAVSVKRNGKSYRNVKLKGIAMKAHNLAFLLVTGRLPFNQIDHIDGNGLNNKWDNLRDVSAEENSKNKKIQSTNKSGISGVHWVNQSQSWGAQISSGGLRVCLGRTKDFFEACCRRKSAEIKYGFHENHGSSRDL